MMTLLKCFVALTLLQCVPSRLCDAAAASVSGLSCAGRTGFFPHPSSCSSFLACVHGQLYVMACPPGLAYNADLKLCDWPSSSGCSQASSPGLAQCTFLCPPHVGYFQFPDWTDCSRYYICIGGTISGPIKCPNGLYYDFWKWTCAYEHDVTCYNP